VPFSGKRVVDYGVTAFDATRHVKSWQTAWRTLTQKAGLPGFRFHDFEPLLYHSACGERNVGFHHHGDSRTCEPSHAVLERYSHVRMEAERSGMETLAVSTRMAGCDTNHDTNWVAPNFRPV
jgi:hypothetical protein